jgi:hypothetical protein
VFEGGLTAEALADMPPGPELATVLARVDRAALNGYDLVEVLRARARQIAHEQAELLADMVEIAHCEAGEWDAPVARLADADDFAADEIRLALHLTRRAADSQLMLAYGLVERLPAVHAALTAGAIDLPRARVFDAETVSLPDEEARAVAASVIDAAPELTTGQLRVRLRRLVIAVDPEAAARRQREAERLRRVEHGLDSEGTATLAGYQLPPDRAATAAARIDALARAAKQAGDPRTLDTLRADLFLSILNGDDAILDAAGGARRGGGVELTVPFTTLMGLSEEPGEVKGWGPVTAEVARKVAEAQRTGCPWRVSVYDDAGILVHHDHLRRRPTAEDAAFVKARDRTCRAPGCRTPAQKADIDHTREWATGGPTVRSNLGVLCRHHHGFKGSKGVSLIQLAPGVFVWRTRLGHVYTVRPEPP